MIAPKNLLNFLKKKNIDFFTGVPDSVTKEFINELNNNKKCLHTVTTNEGSAISLGAGYYLAKNKIPCIYLQNSGLGNAINPLSSICHRSVYSIPLLMLVGWRGSPFSSRDEPQHEVMGKITREMLSLLNIKNCVIRNEQDFKKVEKLIKFSKNNKVPVAVLIEKNIFKKTKNLIKLKKNSYVSRSEFLKKLLIKIKKKTNLVSTTGYTSRELLQIRNDLNFKKGKDFYMVGGMGHSSILASGYAMAKKSRDVICIDGDGSLLMHLGSLLTNTRLKNKNFKHILLNNFSHQSVGGQKTFIENINLKGLVKSLGYKKFFSLQNIKKIDATISNFLKCKGSVFLEVKISPVTLKNLIRPKNLKLIKKQFIS